MAWRALDVDEDGRFFTEGQGSMSPMMALILGRVQGLMEQREREDSEELRQKKETEDVVDKGIKDVKDGNKIGQEIEDDMGGKSSETAACSSTMDIHQEKKKAQKKKKKKGNK